MRTKLLFPFLVGILLSPSVLAQTSVDYAQQGEGIFQLLRRNGINPSTAVLAEFQELNAGKLINGSGLQRGVEYNLPGTVRTMRVPILGPEHELVAIESDVLEGCVYYIISGHGGADPGTVGKRNGHRLFEDEYAYDVALRLGRNLIAQGATVYFMTRDTDGIRDDEYFPADHDERNWDGTYVGRGSNQRLRKRVQEINELHRRHSGDRLERVIELHVDAYAPSKRIDVDFYYNSNAGRRLALTLRQSLKEQYRIVRPGRGYDGRITRRPGLVTLRDAIPVTTYIELGDIHNVSDQKRIIQWDNRQLVADWLSIGFIEDARQNAR